MLEIAPGTLVIHGDIACPWATLAVVPLWEARVQLGLDDSVRFDLRAFPLELANSRGTPRRAVDAEIPVVAPHAPGFGWQVHHDGHIPVIDALDESAYADLLRRAADTG